MCNVRDSGLDRNEKQWQPVSESPNYLIIGSIRRRSQHISILHALTSITYAGRSRYVYVNPIIPRVAARARKTSSSVVARTRLLLPRRQYFDMQFSRKNMADWLRRFLLDLKTASVRLAMATDRFEYQQFKISKCWTAY